MIIGRSMFRRLPAALRMHSGTRHWQESSANSLISVRVPSLLIRGSGAAGADADFDPALEQLAVTELQHHG